MIFCRKILVSGFFDERRLLVEIVHSFIARARAARGQVEPNGILRPDMAQAIFEKSKALSLIATKIPEDHKPRL